jgi:hypothetical protein
MQLTGHITDNKSQGHITHSRTVEKPSVISHLNVHKDLHLCHYKIPCVSGNVPRSTFAIVSDKQSMTLLQNLLKPDFWKE